MKSKKDILRFSNPMKAKKCRKDHDKPFFYTFSIFVESEGFEPSSKQRCNKLSTYLESF